MFCCSLSLYYWFVNVMVGSIRWSSRVAVAILAVLPVLSAGCLDNLIPSYPDYSGLQDVSQPDGVIVDVFEVESETAVCERNCWDRVCGPDDCGGTCGTCPVGTLCALDYSICLEESVLLPTGSVCGQTSVCDPLIEDYSTPGVFYDNPDWPGCLDYQCHDLLCERGLCTGQCVVRNDTRFNGSELDGADGIEDDTSNSDCYKAEGSAWQGEMMCVGRYMNSKGQVVGVCHPASSFMACNPSDACPGIEDCSYVNVMGVMERRCTAVIPGGAKTGDECGFNQITGQTVLCRSWLCADEGCTVPCDTDDECQTECAENSDCSPMVCGAAVAVDGFAVKACTPRNCVADRDCRNPDYYCADSFGKDDTGAVVAVGVCRKAVAGGAPVGAACGADTAGGGTVVCRNRDMCFDGFCSARCEQASDCADAPGSVCGIRQEYYSNGFIGPNLWINTGWCIHTGTRSGFCVDNSDCREGVCTPWTVDTDDGQFVMTSCMAPPAESWPLGTECGELAWNTVCENRFCHGEDIANGQPGWCSRLCSVDADCPELASLGSVDYRWICAGLPVFGQSSGAVEDDLYASWCVPTGAAGSLEDCSVSRFCADPSLVCSPVLRAGPGALHERVDYLCLEAGDGGPIGAICDPFGDGSDCASRLCVASTVGGVGFCSYVCGNEIDCLMFGEGVTCGSVHMGYSTDRRDLAADVCLMEGECVICEDDADCSEDFRCANVSGNYWVNSMRCVRTCDTDADCSSSSGIACVGVSASFSASSQAFNACMTPLCP